jgi:glutathione S-transferase
MPENPEERALTRSWMCFADDYFFPFIFRIRVGAQRGFSEGQIQEARENLRDSLSRLERRLEGREYLMGEFTLADIAHAGNFHRLRELSERGEVALQRYPNVSAWMERVESRESYKASA